MSWLPVILWTRWAKDRSLWPKIIQIFPVLAALEFLAGVVIFAETLTMRSGVDDCNKLLAKLGLRTMSLTSLYVFPVVMMGLGAKWFQRVKQLKALLANPGSLPVQADYVPPVVAVEAVPVQDRLIRSATA